MDLGGSVIGAIIVAIIVRSRSVDVKTVLCVGRTLLCMFVKNENVFSGSGSLERVRGIEICLKIRISNL